MTAIDTVEELKTASERSMDSVVDDRRYLRRAAAESIVERDCEGIAIEMGFVHATRVSRADVYRISMSPKVQYLGDDELRILRRTDVVVEAFDDASRKTYVAMEACIKVSRLDTERALRSAEILTEATGISARAAVCGPCIDLEVEGVIASGKVYWRQFGNEDWAPR